MPDVLQARDAMLAARRAVLTTHVNADGDGVGSEVAVASWLRANGTEAWIINPTPFPSSFRFLLEDPGRVVDAASPEARELCERADVAVVLDTGEVPRIGRVRSLIRELPTVVVDHHQPSDKPIGGISLRDPDACATGELVYDVLWTSNGPWTDVALRGMYVAILTDTGGFRFSNSTPACHHVAADLIARGVDPEAIYTRVYGGSPLRKLRLLRECLGTLEMDEEFHIAWMTVPPEAYAELGAIPEDLEGLVDVPRGVESAGVGLLFRRIKSGEVKVSLRSNGPVDVNRIARRFGGGGHIKAAGTLVKGSLEQARERILEATRAAVAETEK